MVDQITAFFKRIHGPRKDKKREALLNETGNLYLVFNKPKIVPFTQGVENEVTVDKFLPKVNQNLRQVGYYNDTSEGLVLFSDDQSIDSNKLEIEYVVKVDKDITPMFMKKLSQGVQLVNTFVKPIYVEKINNHHYHIVLNETRLGQVDKMTEMFGYHVTRIMRVRIENIVIDNLNTKQSRYLTIDEVNKIKSV